MEDTIKYILVDMDEYLTANQSQKLQRVLVTRLTKQVKTINNLSNDNYLSMFLNANFTLSSMQKGEFRFEPTCWLLKSREWRGLARRR